MPVFEIFSRYFWAVAIVVTAINAAIMKRRSKRHIQEDPELAKGYDQLILGFFFLTNIPWVVMGFGCTVGGVPSVFHYFRPRDGDPFVIAWWISVFVLWLLTFYWVFLAKGAEKLAKYRMFSFSSFGTSGDVTNPTVVKLLILAMLAGGLFAAAMMFMTETPLPLFLVK